MAGVGGIITAAVRVRAHERALVRVRPPVPLPIDPAQAAGVGRLIMNVRDVLQVHEAGPSSLLIGTHMEAINHGVLTRSALRTFAEQRCLLRPILFT